ncbi:MAG: biotin/lipoyl-containing protein [Mariniphaga sp.]|jgi:biotin carboxyl carrier protein
MEDNSKYQVFVVNSARYLTLTTTKFEKRKKWQKSDPNEIRSIIPGSVIDIFASAGQKLKAGEVILTLEAMKMYTRVEMPFDGVIKSINVEKGDRIPKDTVMVNIE